MQDAVAVVLGEVFRRDIVGGICLDVHITLIFEVRNDWSSGEAVFQLFECQLLIPFSLETHPLSC